MDSMRLAGAHPTVPYSVETERSLDFIVKHGLATGYMRDQLKRYTCRTATGLSFCGNFSRPSRGSNGLALGVECGMRLISPPDGGDSWAAVQTAR